MNFLEVGCPHCPSKLTLPRAAAGRMITCPECDRSYLVPTPGAKLPGSDAWAAEPGAKPVKELPTKRTVPEDGATIAYEPAALTGYEPTVADADAALPAPAIKSALREPPQRRAEIKPLVPSRREAASDDPQLATESPLPVLPILDPPRASATVASAQTAAVPDRSHPRPPDIPARPKSDDVNQPSATLAPTQVPRGSSVEDARQLTAEAELRMRRAELRARVNLAIFAVGTLVMVGFAWLVIRFSRPN